MDVQAMQSLLADLSREIGVVERPRKPHGFWTPYAWAVRALVTMNGMSVSDAAKVVIRNAGLVVTEPDVACVRVVYYKIRDMAWPEGMYDALMGRLGEVDTRSGAAILSDIGADVVPERGETITEPDDLVTDVPERGETITDSPIPDDLRAELEAEVAKGFVKNVYRPFADTPSGSSETVDPDADPDYVPEDFQP